MNFAHHRRDVCEIIVCKTYTFNAFLNRQMNVILMQSINEFLRPRRIQCLNHVPKLKAAITADAQCNRVCVRLNVYPMKGKQHLNLNPTLYHLEV